MANAKAEGPSDGPNIHTALLEAMHAVGYVQKTGVNPHHKYRYASESDLIHALRPALMEAGITATVVDIQPVFVNPGHIVAKYTMRFAHGASDSYVDAVALGEGTDTQDKAAYKAATGALKYLLRQACLIETGDDPDSGAGEQEQPGQEQPARPPNRTAEQKRGGNGDVTEPELRAKYKMYIALCAGKTKWDDLAPDAQDTAVTEYWDKLGDDPTPAQIKVFDHKLTESLAEME